MDKTEDYFNNLWLFLKTELKWETTESYGDREHWLVLLGFQGIWELEMFSSGKCIGGKEATWNLDGNLKNWRVLVFIDFWSVSNYQDHHFDSKAAASSFTSR